MKEVEGLIARILETRTDRTRSQALAQWAGTRAAEAEPGDIRDILVEIACDWEIALSAAHESGNPESFMHLELPDSALADWLARAKSASSS